jgi:hypothetical protein
MNDTHPEVEEKIHEMMMARSGAGRLPIGSKMFDGARVVIASKPKDLSKDEFKRRLFEGIYGAPLEDFLTGAVNDYLLKS